MAETRAPNSFAKSLTAVCLSKRPQCSPGQRQEGNCPPTLRTPKGSSSAGWASNATEAHNNGPTTPSVRGIRSTFFLRLQKKEHKRAARVEAGTGLNRRGQGMAETRAPNSFAKSLTAVCLSKRPQCSPGQRQEAIARQRSGPPQRKQRRLGE
ncbi:unnamed protein product [Acanthosepion pharaonis]|uniref:Uncharacterized protein n=1 Tax=Acanthosepion pharaonis TaxID=158019 RepID=A0A812CAU2_ACAPH|nr:unnamed protein product [Sepia pharaonis]